MGELGKEFKAKFKSILNALRLNLFSENILFVSWVQSNQLSRFIFPVTIKPRHKSHLVFQFTETQEMNNLVAQATLNLFVHSRNYLKSTDLQLSKNLRHIDIEVSKVLQGSQHKMIFETFRNLSLPDGVNDGEFLQLNITEMVAEWFLSHEKSHGMAVKLLDSHSGVALPHKIASFDIDNFTTVSY